MISEKEAVHVAANLKLKLVKRANSIRQLSAQLSEYKTGFPTTVSDDRAETMQMQIDHAVTKQEVEGIQYAVMRYVLGVTPGIELDNLELDK